MLDLGSFDRLKSIWKWLRKESRLWTLEESQWLVEGKLSKDYTKKFLEFLFYMFHVSGKTRRAALSLFFKPENKVIDFVSGLEN